MRSGGPSAQPSANRGGAGMSLGSPSGAPASAQAPSTAMSSRDSDWSCLSFGPTPGAGFHGGMTRSAETVAMSDARFLAWAYVSRANGPTWWRRWQFRHFVWRIGATSLVNVGGAAFAGASARAAGGARLAAQAITPTTARSRAELGPMPGPRKSGEVVMA